MNSRENQQIKYKQLKRDELSYFRELNEVFAAAFEDPDTYLGNKPSDEYLERLLSKEHVIVQVALQDNRVVAGLVAYVLEKFEQERTEVYIYDLAVDQTFRRQKIATGLIHSLQKEVQVKGAWVIYVQADKGDEPAMRLYQSLGTEEEVLHYDIPVYDSTNA